MSHVPCRPCAFLHKLKLNAPESVQTSKYNSDRDRLPGLSLTWVFSIIAIAPLWGFPLQVPNVPVLYTQCQLQAACSSVTGVGIVLPRHPCLLPRGAELI